MKKYLALILTGLTAITAAADELQKHLHKSTGTRCEIISDKPVSGTPAFYPGWSMETEDILSDSD